MHARIQLPTLEKHGMHADLDPDFLLILKGLFYERKKVKSYQIEMRTLLFNTLDMSEIPGFF